MAEFDTQVIEEFRANGGQVGGMFAGMDMLILHHTGARSGRRYEHPLAYFRDGERYVIVASKGGAPVHPSWYHNLLAHPDVSVELGTETVEVRAAEVTGAERDRLFERIAEQSPQFAGYQQKTERTIPVIALTPAG
jgi:deazaflavin-dependent oxidoreductase (nitroreductase family)